MHPIMKYLKARGMTQAAFSPIAGLSKQQLNGVVMGHSRLSLKSALRVVTASGGEISLADIANWQPEEGNHAAKDA